MPTAADYDAMVGRLVDAEETMSLFATKIVDEADSTVMRGTQIEAIVRTAVDEAFGNAVSASIACGALAELCRGRAMVCREYTADYANYLTRSRDYAERVEAMTPGAHFGSPPYPPPRPAPWAELS